MIDYPAKRQEHLTSLAAHYSIMKFSYSRTSVRIDCSTRMNLQSNRVFPTQLKRISEE
jgi:hypothetical protein